LIVPRPGGELRASDLVAVREQLGREPTTPFSVVARCADGGRAHPLVIRNHPLDAEARPFPTVYWLTCPHAVRAVSRVEAEGWIGRLNERYEADPEFHRALDETHRAYANERGRFSDGADAWGGVGGTRVGLKCLHAHYAYHLAGGKDPVGSWVAERVEPVHPERAGRVAAVDLGTNSIRLIVAEPAQTDFVELARDMVITRIGQGVDRTGRIDPLALERTIAVLESYCRRARALHAGRIRVAATSAVRDAGNRSDLEAAVLANAGSALEVIAGDREAALSFLGATADLDRPAPFLVMDIGGGSTEFVVGSSPSAPQAAISTQMGSVRLTERLVRHDPPTPAELAALAGAVDEVLEEVERTVPASEAKTFVAVAGTATTVQAVALDLPRYDPDAIHQTTLTLKEADGVLQRLAGMTSAQRAVFPVMAPGREDVIVAGATILVRSMRRWGFERALVSERDILDGLVMDLMGSSGDPSGDPSVPGEFR
jgi:exopolyphosphatase/guanosine-5'-triphosphate,3'-diphosphate pyrophosphatase